MRLWRALAVDAGDVVPCPRTGEALVASVPRRASTGPTGPRASAPPGADVAALRVPAPGESMPAPPVVSAPEGVGGAARPRRAYPRPRRPGARSTCRCAVIHCGRGVRGSRFGDVTWARISPGGLARIERRWISSLRARIVRAEADCVALTWHYASRARSVLVPARASPVRAGPDPRQPGPRQPAPRGGRLIRTRRETARPALVPARESAGSRFGVDADPDPVPVPFRLGRVHEIVG